MGIHDRPYYRDEQRPQGIQLGAPQTMVGFLILINVAAFLLTNYFLHRPEWFLVTADVAVHPALWWKFLTCGFGHENVQHIFFNMIMLIETASCCYSRCRRI